MFVFIGAIETAIEEFSSRNYFFTRKGLTTVLQVPRINSVPFNQQAPIVAGELRNPQPRIPAELSLEITITGAYNRTTRTIRGRSRVSIGVNGGKTGGKYE